MAAVVQAPRRSSRRASAAAAKKLENTIVIDDDDEDDSILSPNNKIGLRSRRTSGTVTPATSVETAMDGSGTDTTDNKAIFDLASDKRVRRPSASASTNAQLEAPVIKRRGRPPGSKSAKMTNDKKQLTTSASEQKISKNEDQAASAAIDLTLSTQESGNEQAAHRRSTRARKSAAKPEPLDTAPESDAKPASASNSKAKGKSRASEDISMADYVMDSDDEDHVLRHFREMVHSSFAKNSNGTDEDPGATSCLVKGEENELSHGADSLNLDVSDDDEEYTPKKRGVKRTRLSVMESMLPGAKVEDEEASDESAEEVWSDLSSESDDDDDDGSDAPLAGPSAAPGSHQEDQRWETEKQRQRRLKREAREARINANARRTGRKRKVDKRSHYQKSKDALVEHHPELATIWNQLSAAPKRVVQQAKQPTGLTIKLLPFQLEGLDWLTKQEKSEWKGGILADEMGMGKTIQIISLFLSDRKKPNLVVAPTVAILQWRNEIAKYTTGFKVVVWHGANRSSDANALKSADVVLVSYGVLESAFRKKIQGFRRKGQIIKEDSVMHGIDWHRVILDEAHNIKERATNTAKAAFELKSKYRWCLSGTPLQNRVGELYSMIRFLDGDPFSYYYCKRCPCKSLHWMFSDRRTCDQCGHTPMHHTCFWNNDILKPIQRYGTVEGEGRDAFNRLRLLLERMMLRRTKLERADDMGLPPRTVEVRRDMFNEEEEDLYESLYTDTTRKFSTYLDQGTILNNYSNIFTLLTRMRQLACHPDLVLRSKTGIAQKLLGDGAAGSIHVCRICQDEAEDPIMSKCRHIFCRECVRQWIGDGDKEDGRAPECPYCHATLTIDLEADALDPPRGHEDKNARQGILARLDMNSWRSSTKIEALVEELMQLRTEDKTIKSLVFSQFVNFLDLIAFRLTRAGFNICRLEGNMSPEARNKTIEHFMNNPGVTVFLVSLKAGGVALNLTEASRVYLMDPWWNPSVEVQAMDRIHRLGQHRPIIVKRMVVENSIESRIIELQNKKSAMIEAAIGKDDSAMGRLSVSDLSFLFSL